MSRLLYGVLFLSKFTNLAEFLFRLLNDTKFLILIVFLYLWNIRYICALCYIKTTPVLLWRNFSIFVRYWNNELIVKTFLTIHWEMNRRIIGVHEERRERRRLNYIYHSSSSLLPTLFLLFSFLLNIDVKKHSFIRMCNCSGYSLFYYPEQPSWIEINLPPPLLKCLHTKKVSTNFQSIFLR